MNVIDLFAGVGGLSLGAARAGFNIQAAVELDKIAIESHSLNFPHSVHLNMDISCLKGKDLLSAADLNELDCLIGGPPCQGFSNIGKGNVEDVRNELYHHFFRLVSELKPKCFMAENVPGIMNVKYNAIRENALSLVSDNYHILPFIRANASDYGAATRRERIFFIGVSKDFDRNTINHSEFMSDNLSIPSANVDEALYGLPYEILNYSNRLEDGWCSIFRNKKGYFYDRLWGVIPPKVGNRMAINELKNGRVSGVVGTIHTEQVIERYKKVPQGGIDKISRSMRLHPQGLCPTLRAGTSSDKGSYQALRPIHPYAHRVITPREAARLQGFPDWFLFHETKWHSFRQIGNSVSPFVAEALMKPLLKLCQL